MKSIEKEVLEAIQKQINDGVESINYVDEDWGQLDFYGPQIPVKWPCVLINIAGANFSNIGRDNNLTPPNRQIADQTVELTVANLKLTNSSYKAPNTQKWHAFEMWEVLQEVHQKIQSFRPSERTGMLIRSSYQRIRRDDGVQAVRIVYTLTANNV